MSIALALAAPAVLLAGVLARTPEARMEALPEALRQTPKAPTSVLAVEYSGLWGATPILTRLFPAPHVGANVVVELEPQRDLRRPDLLVYWMPASQDADAFPAKARLLGRLAATTARRFSLPEAQGSLVLYSLGHQERVATATLPAAPEAR